LTQASPPRGAAASVENTSVEVWTGLVDAVPSLVHGDERVVDDIVRELG
jgi:hypothetical protein